MSTASRIATAPTTHSGRPVPARTPARPSPRPGAADGGRDDACRFAGAVTDRWRAGRERPPDDGRAVGLFAGALGAVLGVVPGAPRVTAREPAAVAGVVP
ncbi:hypothetical protein ACIB24_16670 [Spongisporangium articulatum]|uniref:Uncharacterized protein n=1 Tax=Spongisporangium articulatum TaxID=3362603 RepID=A0ABW8AQQ0_9ACTN